MNEIVPRATLADIERRRNEALALFAEADAMDQAAADKRGEAARALRAAAPLSDGLLPQHMLREIEGNRHKVDAQIWSSVVKMTDLDRYMDKKAKDDLRQSLLTDPPEFTEDNAVATLQGFMAEAGMIFRRGIAEMFSDLDRRFRSHSGWKIGSRVILTYVFNDFGWWNHYRNHRDTLQDIERTFLVLDGRKAGDEYSGIVGEIEQARRDGCYGARQTEVESEFYKVRIFKNGNVHLWFKRDDLVRKANRMIGEYYGEVIPEEREPADDGGLHEPKRTLAKNHGFFPTPDDLAERVIEEAHLLRRSEEPLEVLEPSAGTGQLSRRAAAKGAQVDCVEIQADHVQRLRLLGCHRRIYKADFFDLSPEATGLYDRVIMNPPFDRERDIDHVMHALKFLKPGGFLIAIMSAHTEFAQTKKAVAFRELMEGMQAHFDDNPRGSFSSVGTNVNTIRLRVYKDGRHFW